MITKDIIRPRYKKFLKCPCCGKRMQTEVLYKSKDIKKSVQIEPIHMDTCSKCGKVSDNIHIHHEKYDDNNPLAHTIPLCGTCHAKYHNEGIKKTQIGIANLLSKMGLLGKD